MTKPERYDMAVDADGHPLPYSPTEVRAIVQQALDEGDVLAVVMRTKDDDLAVQVFGPPSHKLLTILEQATHAYRRVLKGH